MKPVSFSSIDAKWQKEWEKLGIFEAKAKNTIKMFWMKV
jgi:leucyl-tRNA synthetase